MINTIFTLSLQDHLDEATTEQFTKAGCVWVLDIPEMRPIDTINPIQALLPSVEFLAQVKPLFDSFDLRGNAEVVGVWNEDGTQYGYYRDAEGLVVRDDALTIQYPFNIALYQTHLNDRVTYDEQGQVIESHRPTLEEARTVQVNKFAGMADRILQ